MYDATNAPDGLIFSPLGIRVRMKAPGPANALDTRRENYEAIDLYFSDLRDDFLAGRVKRVANAYRADARSIQASYSIVAAPAGEWPLRAARHRAELIGELRFQYKNAVVRAASTNPKNAKRMRERLNKQLGSRAPDPAAVDAAFADHPDALLAVAGIRQLLGQVDG